MRVRLLVLAVLAILSVFANASTLRAETVNLELVLAIDTSTSVDDQEFLLQRDGLASAFRDQTVMSAIRSLGEEGIAVTVIQWSGPGQQRVAVDWQRLTGEKSAHEFASAISKMPRLLKGFTDIAGAISFSHNSIISNKFEGRRKTIDVSGDGTSDRNDPAFQRDMAVRAGMTVNGLLIHSVEYDLGDLARIALIEHYTNRVIGGDAAFVLEADSFDDFSHAIRNKLMREIAGPQFSLNLAD